MNKKGFTLLELLIVIGILAILAAVTVLVINPAQLLKRARDSQRMSDLSTLQTAIGLYLTDAASPSIVGTGNCYFTISAGTPNYCAVSAAGCTAVNCATTTDYQKTNGSGWIPINFNIISGGSPLGSLPTDPTNSSGTTHAAHLYYTYKANTSLAYEINANLESAYYIQGGTTDKESKDGGNAPEIYEVGNSTTLMTTGTGLYPN